MDSSIPINQLEERKRDELEIKEMVHKTKVIQFLGRTIPIILQNDNGPCPLLAICNLLLLKNNLSLSPDVPEVSQEKLLSLVAERLIDSNSNVNDKDAEYVKNQQQNIGDAIDLLPRLATGIDVNIKFRRIGDFEFTRECAIFDLLDIPLYHGWILDPQDHDTANAIGSKSYNTLMGELVALDTQNMDSEDKKSSEDDCVDFAAATTAALGVPSPCLSRGRSFDDSPVSIADHHREIKGEIEESELLRVLKLSEAEKPNSSVETAEQSSLNEMANLKCHEPVVLAKTSEGNAVDTLQILQHEALIAREDLVSNGCNISGDCNLDPNSFQSASGDVSSSLKNDQEPSSKDCQNENLLAKDEGLPLEPGQVSSSACEDHVHLTGSGDEFQGPSTTIAYGDVAEENQDGCNAFDSSSSLTPRAISGSPSGKHGINEPETFDASIDGSEPIYEGEDCILESATTSYKSREPMYEGEVVLAEQVDGSRDVPKTNSKGEITPREGELVRNFLKNSASQLTFYGLFSLQEGLKERELCVFFRNNHFNTMFKFEGDLYILATDQGYINQSDLVWEKLNEVNGDTIFVTSNFKEFKVEDNGNAKWDEQSAMASTADYLANINNSGQGHTSFNSDLQLALALQEQEFEQQQAPQRNHSPRQPVTNIGSGLIVGPQVPRNNGRYTSSSTKQEPKSSKDKCIVM